MIYTKDISDDFFPKMKAIAEMLGADPLHMMAVMYSESGCSAKAHNDNPKNLEPEKRWNASGLIQFMPPTLHGLGYRAGHAAFRALTATQQLDYVAKYYSQFKGKLGSIAALYVATFLPALTANAADPAFVLTAKGGVRGWAFGPNAAFDADGNGQITVKELDDAVQRNCKGNRWAELKARLTGEGIEAQPPAIIHSNEPITTVRGLQCALSDLGFDPGPIDGHGGPKTTAGVLAFQESKGLTADGIYGPKTKAALAAAIDIFRKGKKSAAPPAAEEQKAAKA